MHEVIELDGAHENFASFLCYRFIVLPSPNPTSTYAISLLPLSSKMSDPRPICHNREALIWPIRFVNSFLCPEYHYTPFEAIEELGPVPNINYTVYGPKYIPLTSLGMLWCR